MAKMVQRIKIISTEWNISIMERMQQIKPNLMGSKTMKYFNSNGYGYSFGNRGGFGKYGKKELSSVTTYGTKNL